MSKHTNTTSNAQLTESCSFKVIYAYRITGSEAHKNLLKVGDASLKDVPASKAPRDFSPNCSELKEAAIVRIKEQTATAGLFPQVEILHAELAIDNAGRAFRDYDVHRTLENSGIKAVKILKPASEWFKIDLETAKSAIEAVKSGKGFIRKISTGKSPIILRDEQKAAVRMAARIFKTPGSRVLWNAKMRFGKTLSALEVVKVMNFSRTIIVTHRPAVEDSWFEDFEKIFYESDTQYIVGGRSRLPFETLERAYTLENKKYVYFASMQDLRGSALVSGDFDKNHEVFCANWDCVIIDEAHEGTQTDRGQNVLSALKKKDTRTLALSGTPFNVVGKYKDEEIFTWDYIQEQTAKLQWEKDHPGEPNPYAALPRMNIRTYALGSVLNNPEFIEVEDKAFSFSEFFRVGENGKFIHETDVDKFLNLLVGKSPNTQYYPYANEDFRTYFRHSLWMLPGVPAAAQLEKLLKTHDVFGVFKIVNVAGDGNAKDDDEAENNALARVKSAIEKNDYTITLSCGRLTTGVTVPEWTAVLYLAGGYKTSPATYLQTIFRVQSPGSVNGRAKEECYAFDFAPDRVIAIVEQVAQFSAGKEKKAKDREKRVQDFIDQFTNFAPVIAYSGSETQTINTDYVLREIKKICISQVVQSGFSSPKLYNNKLWNLTDSEIDLFKDLEGKIGKSAPKDLPTEVVINQNDLVDGKASDPPSGEETSPPIKPFTPEKSEEEKERRKKRENALAVLTNAAVRIPLLVFGADGDVNKTFSSENFTEHFDDNSWAEFMGKLTKEDFKKSVAPFLEETVFSGACSRIRERVYAADKLPVRERLQKIVEIHSEFKNPDKETVLTPWRVVNAQLSETLGGYKFFENLESEDGLDKPRFADHGEVTKKTLGNPNSTILEINSKSGLYPLFLAYSLMRAKFEACPPRTGESAENCFTDAWFNAVAQNIFVVCKTKMAAAITRRTLVGFNSGAKTNILVEENIIKLAKNPQTFLQLVQKIKNPKTWNLKENTEMKFNAIVGNPPYQAELGGASALPVYHHYVELAKALGSQYISLITPARWFNTGSGLDVFRKTMLSDERISVLHDFWDARMLFPSVEIKGGIIYFLWDREYNGNCQIYSHLSRETTTRSFRKMLEPEIGVFVRNSSMISIIKKVMAEKGMSFSSLVSSRDPFGYDIRLPGSFKVAKHKFNSKPSELANTAFYYNGWRKNGVGYVASESINCNEEWRDLFKVLIPKAWGTGKVATDRLGAFIAGPNSVCTETYLVVGPFDSEITSKNVISYINTKFFHTLVSVLKISQNATQSVYRFVPVQDFSKPWTDAELYEKYKLTKDEIAFIESMIRPME